MNFVVLYCILFVIAIFNTFVFSINLIPKSTCIQIRIRTIFSTAFLVAQGKKNPTFCFCNQQFTFKNWNCRTFSFDFCVGKKNLKHPED